MGGLFLWGVLQEVRNSQAEIFPRMEPLQGRFF